MMFTTCRYAKALQLTLAVIKPDAMAHPLILEALHQKILENHFIIIKSKDLVWRREDSQRFYAEHAGRFFYQRLVEFMSSGPMRAYILARENAISQWRELMGPTKVFRARYTAPTSIRGVYGLTDTRNTTHGSDSAQSASREIAFFFPEFNMKEWTEKEEPLVRAGHVVYDKEKQIHVLKKEV
ncbi:nucleoside diphosphate kinase 6 [Lepisosteus oculatus]|uniref:nucleoside diphosphate kinase 6 n=1 Tax=Lepisosteus oculatus TaxID=7918 RepID=UPI0003EABFE5|nr:PREDICTED: nucleoside diphosphate kinase 6 [Lepisosteus oculatus]XP_015207711.1 PREDICTED: nucleoside diphosphate kinase 6 [Lepisosteus oculatus]